MTYLTILSPVVLRHLKGDVDFCLKISLKTVASPRIVLRSSVNLGPGTSSNRKLGFVLTMTHAGKCSRTRKTSKYMSVMN